MIVSSRFEVPRFIAYRVCPDSRQLEKDFFQALASLCVSDDRLFGPDVLTIAQANSIAPLNVDRLQRFPGGVGGFMQFAHESVIRPVVFGSRIVIEECGLEIPELLHSVEQDWESEVSTRILFGGWSGHVHGVIKLRLPTEIPRKNKLKKQGVLISSLTA